MTNGSGEVDFVNTGYQVSTPTLTAFDWYIMTSSVAKQLLMRLYHDGSLLVNGLLNATAGLTTTTLTATGVSTLANVNVLVIFPSLEHSPVHRLVTWRFHIINSRAMQILLHKL